MLFQIWKNSYVDLKSLTQGYNYNCKVKRLSTLPSRLRSQQLMQFSKFLNPTLQQLPAYFLVYPPHLPSGIFALRVHLHPPQHSPQPEHMENKSTRRKLVWFIRLRTRESLDLKIFKKLLKCKKIQDRISTLSSIFLIRLSFQIISD